ncbi:MAG TPA: hypothetical protein PKE38_00670, partial [Ignavibacteriaceae bacterium]|nr:hypothetical protein [Ignavibacteriaceae bacterium]
MSASTILGYGLLKLPQSKIDPYTRATIGITVGAGMFLSPNPLIRYVGIGVVIAGALQITDVFKGGRLSSNEAQSKVYVLHETKGVIELQSNEIPDYNIDGFTFKGLNCVFKLSDGVYAGINLNNDIDVLGVGAIVNKIRNAGLKSKSWIDTQTDKRWSNLYNLSV